jgi:hypothetical protein
LEYIGPGNGAKALDRLLGSLDPTRIRRSRAKCNSRIVSFLRPKANSGDRVRNVLAARIAATVLLLIIDELCGWQMSKKNQVRAPKAEIAVAVSQSIRKHLELLGPEGTGFEKRPETNQ